MIVTIVCRQLFHYQLLIEKRMSKTTILEVYQDKKGMYRFRLLAKNGEPVCASEGYAKKAGAMLAAKKLSEWVTKATLVDADKKADAASKTTGKQKTSVKKNIANKTEASKVEAKTATKQKEVVPLKA
jgi:uncharacterized protein YegP (UPF0339 family)